MDLIETLQSLEPVFKQAGELACKMQVGVEHHNKFDTGNSAVDIVTSADLAVQELLLEAMSKTDLINCRLLAEEKTPLTNKFNDRGKYYLSVDPIDGTAIYAKGGKCFCQIITLHDGKKVIYMYVHYPLLNWTLKITNNNISISGQTPDFSLPADAKNAIVYWTINPEENLPQELLGELKERGLHFAQANTLGKDLSSIIMLACGQIAGVCDVNPNVYDGLTEYSIGLAKCLKIYSSGMNLANIQKRESGLYYPGYCIELTNL